MKHLAAYFAKHESFPSHLAWKASSVLCPTEGIRTGGNCQEGCHRFGALQNSMASYGTSIDAMRAYCG